MFFERPKWLLEMGSDSDPQGDNLQTPLFWACTRGNFDTVLLLLSKGENGEPLADINHKDSVGATPVMIAIQFLNCKAAVAHTVDRQIKATEVRSLSVSRSRCSPPQEDISQVSHLVGRRIFTEDRKKDNFVTLRFLCKENNRAL